MFDHNDSEDELSNLLYQIEGEEQPRKKERQDLNARLNLNLNEQRVSKQSNLSNKDAKNRKDKDKPVFDTVKYEK